MDYTNQSCEMFEKHVWQTKKISFYVMRMNKEETYEIEIAFHKLDCNDNMVYERSGEMITYRIDNTASEKEATEIVANLLEVFSN